MRTVAEVMYIPMMFCTSGLILREGAARDRELRVLATEQSNVDRSFMEAEFAKARYVATRNTYIIQFALNLAHQVLNTTQYLGTSHLHFRRR
jgi:hypothetical protein